MYIFNKESFGPVSKARVSEICPKNRVILKYLDHNLPFPLHPEEAPFMASLSRKSRSIVKGFLSNFSSSSSRSLARLSPRRSAVRHFISSRSILSRVSQVFGNGRKKQHSTQLTTERIAGKRKEWKCTQSWTRVVFFSLSHCFDLLMSWCVEHRYWTTQLNPDRRGPNRNWRKR